MFLTPVIGARLGSPLCILGISGTLVVDSLRRKNEKITLIIEDGKRVGVR